MAFENWPYANFHDLNLDWILKQIKELGIKIDNVTAQMPHVSDYNGGIWDNTHAYTAGEIVFDNNDVFIAIRDVPAGIAITDTTYWTQIANLGFDPSTLQSEIDAVEARCDVLEANTYYVTPEDYGAVRDGVTDCSDALEAALNTGIPVRLLQGANGYLVKKPVTVTTDNARMAGPCDAFNTSVGNTAAISLTETGKFIINAEYFQAEDVYFYSYNRTAGDSSAIVINGPDGLNGDAFVRQCIFSSCNDTIVCNARGLMVIDCHFARGTPAITLNYVGNTSALTPVTYSTVTGGRGFMVRGCRYHAGVNQALKVQAGSTVYNLIYSDNLTDVGGGAVDFYGDVENANIHGCVWTLCNRAVLTVNGCTLKNSVFANNVCKGEDTVQIPNDFIEVNSTGAIKNVTIDGNEFRASAYRAINLDPASTCEMLVISDNVFDELNITGDNITYAAINLPDQFNGVNIVGNMFGQVAPTAAGACVRSMTEASPGSLNMLQVLGNIKYYDKDYLAHSVLQTNAVNSNIQTYRLNP